MAKKRKKKRKSKDQLEPRDYLEIEQVRFILEILKRQAENGLFRTAVRLFIFQLLLNTGMRRGEAAGLDLGDLPGSHGKPYIALRWAATKGRRNRNIIISDEFRMVLDAYIQRFRKGCGPKAPLLLNEYGNRMTGANIYARLKTISGLAGIDLHPHQMRHTLLGFLYQVDHDLMSVMAQAGHQNINTTKIYVNMGDSARKRQVSRLGHLAT